MKLVDKTAVVAEIEKIKCKVDDGSSYCNGWQHALRKLEIEINTLEVKEVDLEKEISDYINDHYKVGFYETVIADYGPADKGPLTTFDVKQIAKHFFELGLRAQKGE